MTIKTNHVAYDLGLFIGITDSDTYELSRDDARSLLAHIDAQAARIAELERLLHLSAASFSNERTITVNLSARLEQAEKELAALKISSYREEFIDACRTIGSITKMVGISEDEVTGHPSQIFDAINALKSRSEKLTAPVAVPVSEILSALRQLYSECDTGERRADGSQRGVSIPDLSIVESVRVLLARVDNSGSKPNGRKMPPHEFAQMVNELRDIPAIQSKRELIVKVLSAFNIRPKKTAGGSVSDE